MIATLEITLHDTQAPQKTVKDYVLEDFRSASIFEKYGLDFCCGGGKTVEEACAKKGIAFEDVKLELDNLELYGKGEGIKDRFQDWSLSFLAEYIINNHHHYVRQVTPTILTHADKVAHVHAERWPYMIQVAEVFADLVSELTSHMYKEEAILFPRLRTLEVEHLGDSFNSSHGFPRTLGGPISQMMIEHDAAGEMMQRIRTLTNNITLPEGGCTTFRTLLAELEAFEKDLHQHVFLENNILFPKAIALEEGIKRASN
jgi:regulator of cell morphogenesis and NO signaling